MSRHSIPTGRVAAFFVFGGYIMPEYSNSDMCRAIDEYCHNSRYRQLLRLRYCEGHTYEEIAEAVNFSPQHVKHICKSYKALLISHI